MTPATSTDPRDVLGLDGKRYRRNLTPGHRLALVDLAHGFRCGAGMTIRRTAEAMAAAGEPVSIGTLHRYLRDWRCPDCPGVQVAQTPHLNTSEAVGR